MNAHTSKTRRAVRFVNALSFSWLTAAGVGVALGAAVLIRPNLQPSLSLPVQLQNQAPLIDLGWERMIAGISDRARSFDGEVGIYIKDLKTGRVYRKNDTHRFLSASLI